MNDPVGYVFIMRGPSGTGKTELTNFLVENMSDNVNPVAHALSDDVMVGGGYRHKNRQEVQRARDQVFQKFLGSLDGRELVIFNDPNLRTPDFKRFAEAAEEAGYRAFNIERTLYPNDDVLAARNRHGATARDIDYQKKQRSKYS